ncbi:hypothetical protein BJ322DRAFT_817871, partial [Thelephora terrestris]
MCLPGTRKSVLDGMMEWAKNPQERRVLWLNGLAGTGKSTIAQTFSGMVAEAEILGASFFCSRDYHRIIPVIEKKPSIASNSLISQLEELIVDPLSSTNISCVIVVDALDECIDDQPASAILSVLGRHVKNLPSVKFFITGRPEPRIRTGFRLSLPEPIAQIFLLHKVKSSDVDKDIRLYLREKLTAVAKRRSDFDLTSPWPCDQDLTTLTKKSAGLFIFASTLAKFIESDYYEPGERLQLIVNQPDSTTYEGVAGIDPLYAQVLELAFSAIKEADVFTNLRRILGTVILAFNPLSRKQIAKILGINAPHIKTILRHLHSVLLVPDEDHKEIRVFHKSFPDFLQDPTRSPDPKFLIDPPTHHGNIALGCLKLLKKLKPNPCDLPDYVMNRDVPDIPELLEEKVGSATLYACGHWAMHIQSSPATGAHVLQLIASATEFLTATGIQWIEVMSLENRLESAVHSIHSLIGWFGRVDVPTSNLGNLAEDYLRFMKNFFLLIQQSAPHIYHSALPLSPRSSTFHSMTHQEKASITEFYGCPETWGAVIQTIPIINTGMVHPVYTATFGHWIAVAQFGEVMIYDSITGGLTVSLRPEHSVDAMGGSPDGSILFCGNPDGSVTLWDIQTGGLAHTFSLKYNLSYKKIAVSVGGRFFACGKQAIMVFEVAGRGEDAFIWEASQSNGFCWLAVEEQLAVADREGVKIWNIVDGTILQSIEIVEIGHKIYTMVCSQEANQLAIATFKTVVIINLQTGTLSSVLSHDSGWSFVFAFSRKAEEIVCTMNTGGLGVFNFSTCNWRFLKYPSGVKFISTMQNGTIVANFHSGICLLNLDVRDVPSSQSLLADYILPFDQGRIIVALLDSTHLYSTQLLLLETSTMCNILTTTFQLG